MGRQYLFNTFFNFLIMSLLKMLVVAAVKDTYKIGVGIADCTGPAAEIVFMGYAKTTQKGCGIHLRQFSRAFIFDDGETNVAFVSVDAAMMSHGIRKAVLKRLSILYNNTYREENLILSGTHTHGAPGGFLMDLMLDIPSFGFVRETFDALVVGILRSIKKAHENMVTGKIYFSSGELLDANINRSPTAYLLNPEEERFKYNYNVDKEMVQLKLVRSSDNTPIGVINWFAVHPTSMNNSNCLVTSDNVGYASILFEKYINIKTPPRKGAFVAAFASTNLGDVSPNIKGPRCINTGEVCDNATSTCKGHAKFCIASGPGSDMFESTKIIAKRMYQKAKELFDGVNFQTINGPLKHIHQFVDMPKEIVTIEHPNGTTYQVNGCLPAMGYSFAAGTTDGPGEFNFSQGTLSTNPFWSKIRDFIFPPTPEDVSCQHPKPILINTGRIQYPYEWQPRIVSTQLFLIGNVALIAVPGEFTTMSGRRLRDMVHRTIAEKGGPLDIKPIIAGLSNVYSSYIVTPEEYQMQRYEGASTIFGPHTLTIYLNIYRQLATALVQGTRLEPGLPPPDFSSKLISLVPPVLFDTAGLTKKFGDCIVQPPARTTNGATVSAKFIAGHPRNNNMQGRTFLAVEKLNENEMWDVVATDGDWETKFIWKRTSFLRGGSQVTIEWDIGRDVESGTYRIRHFGYYKSIFGDVKKYEGATNAFQVQLL